MQTGMVGRLPAYQTILVAHLFIHISEFYIRFPNDLSFHRNQIGFSLTENKYTK